MTKQKLGGVVKRGSCVLVALAMASAMSVPAMSLQAFADDSDVPAAADTQDSTEASMTADEAIAEAFGCLWNWASDNGQTRPNQISESKKGVLAKVYLGMTAEQQELAKAKAPGFANAVKDPDSYADKATEEDIASAKSALMEWASSAEDEETKQLYHEAANGIDQVLDDAGTETPSEEEAMSADQAMADAFGYLVGWTGNTADKPANIDPSYKGVLNEVYAMLTDAQVALIDSVKKQQFQNYQGQSADKGLADFSASVTVQARNEVAKAVLEWAAETTDSDKKSFYETAATTIANKLEELNSKTDGTSEGEATEGTGDSSASPAAVSKKANTLTVTRAKKTVKLKYNAVRKAAKKVKNITVKKAKGTVTVKNVSSKSKVKKWKVSYKSGKVIVKVPKKTAKKTYTVKVKVTAAGNASYKKLTKTISFKVKVA